MDDQRSSQQAVPPMILNKSMGRKDDRDSEAGQTGGERIESGQSSDGNTKDADKGYLTLDSSQTHHGRGGEGEKRIR